MSDINQSSSRSFYCRDSLWQMYASIANEKRCSIDYLINEAMILYLRENKYDTSFLSYPEPARPAYANQAYEQAPIHSNPYDQNLGFGQGAYSPQSQMPYEQAAYQQKPAVPKPPSPPAYRRPPSIYEEPNAPPVSPQKPIVLASLEEKVQPSFQAPRDDVRRLPLNRSPYANEAVEPVRQQAASYASPHSAATQVLYLYFDNKRYAIDKDKYIIGRSSQLADLAIRDGNISRKHCAIIYKNGAHYIKDLDSTNGVEYKGSRIDSKKIEEGDKFNICEYQFRFSYHPNG